MSKRRYIEDAQIIDISRLNNLFFLKNKGKKGIYKTNFDLIEIETKINPEESWLYLRNVAEDENIYWRIKLCKIKCNLPKNNEGSRFTFECPSCNRKIRKIFRINTLKSFKCIRCSKLFYGCQYLFNKNEKLYLRKTKLCKEIIETGENIKRTIFNGESTKRFKNLERKIIKMKKISSCFENVENIVNKKINTINKYLSVQKRV